MTTTRPECRSTHTTTARRWAVFGLLLSVLVGTNTSAQPPADDSDRFAFDKDRHYLQRVRDFQPLRLGGLEPQEWDEKEPFEDLVLHAHAFDPAELIAAGHKDISYGNMMAENELLREEVRFELVHIQGKLKRLKRMGASTRLKQAGVEQLYEAWIFPNGAPATAPVCLILSRKPDGVEPADDITPGIPVTSSGYFFKVVEYSSSEPNPKDRTRTLYRRAPLLIGQSIETGPAPQNSPPQFGNMMAVTLAIAVVVIVLLMGLTVWLRRTDTGSRAAVERRRRNPYIAPPASEVPDAGPPGG